MTRAGRYLALLLAMSVPAGISSAFALDPGREGYRKLTGAEIRRAFIDHTFSDGTHFSTNYHADGLIDGKSMGKQIANRWAVVHDELCITNTAGELCYVVWKKGFDVLLVAKDSDATIYGSLR
jgi:hypothetical protein